MLPWESYCEPDQPVHFVVIVSPIIYSNRNNNITREIPTFEWYGWLFFAVYVEIVFRYALKCWTIHSCRNQKRGDLRSKYRWCFTIVPLVSSSQLRAVFSFWILWLQRVLNLCERFLCIADSFFAYKTRNVDDGRLALYITESNPLWPWFMERFQNSF